MSSTQTKVSAYEWSELQRYLADVDAYVITWAAEAARIRKDAEQRRKELAAMQAANQKITDSSVNALISGYKDLLHSVHGATAAAKQQGIEFEKDLQDLLAGVDAASAKIHDADRRVAGLANQYNAIFQAMQAKRTQLKDRAEAFQVELNRFLARIEELEPEKFLPGEYAKLTALRASVAANMDTGDYGAALIVTHNGIFSAASTLTRLTWMKEQYQQQLNDVLARAAGLRDRVDALSTQSGALRANLHGQQLEYDYDIGYWSNGAFEKLKQRLNALEAQLAGGMTMPELAAAGQSLVQLEAELDACDQQSRQALLGTIFAEDTAVRLCSSLVGQGWSVEESGHYGEESRNPYVMRVGDGNGNTVSIVVSSGERAEEPTYAIEVFSDNEHNAASIKSGIHETIGDQGLNVLDMEHRDDCYLNPDPATFVANVVGEKMTQRG